MPETFRVGAIIYNFEGKELTITKIQVGKHGIALEGRFLSGNQWRGYVVPSLPPYDGPGGEQKPFFEFGSRTFITLLGGRKIGCVSFRQLDGRPRTPQEYDAAWERSMERAGKIVAKYEIGKGGE